MAAGTVLSLHRWPVKSLGGEQVDALRIDRRGAGGDRAQALLGIFGGRRQRLTVRQVPRMLGWQASYPQAPGAELDPDAPPLPVLMAPDGRGFAWDDPRLPGALRDDLGRPVDLCRDMALMPDLQDSLLVTVEASRAALEGGFAPTCTCASTRQRLRRRAGRAGGCASARPSSSSSTRASAARSPRATPTRT